MKEASPRAHDAHGNATLRTRIDGAIVHEYEEARTGSHDAAMAAGPATALPVSGQVRAYLTAIAEGGPG